MTNREKTEFIEKVSLKFPTIDQAVSVVHSLSDHEIKISLYYTTTSKNFKIHDFKAYLSENLSSDLLPEFFIQLTEFPYNTNNEIDRNRLPVPIEDSSLYTQNEVDDVEKRLLKILNSHGSVHSESINLEDDLFSIGVNSLIFIELVVLIEDEFNFEFEDEMLDVELFKTVRSVANYIIKCISEK